MKRGKSRDAARESAGIPLRYLPVRTPRPSGDHGSSPKPRAWAAASRSGSAVRFDERVLDLVGHQGHPGLLEQGHGASGLPPAEVGDPDVARAAGVDRPLQGRQGLGQRGLVGPGVHQPQVDVVGPEPLERGVELAQQAVPGGVDDAVPGPAGDTRLRADDEVVTLHVVVDEPADDLLGGAVGVAVGGVDEVAAGVEEGAGAARGRPPRRSCAPRSSSRGRGGTPTARRSPFVAGAWFRTVVRRRQRRPAAHPPLASLPWNSE